MVPIRLFVAVLVVLLMVPVFSGCLGAEEAPENTEEKNDGPVFTEITGAVAGVVLTNRLDPVEGATVNLVLQDSVVAQAETDADGRYTLDDVEPGSYRIQVSAVCCHEHVQGIEVEAGKAISGDVLLRPYSAADLNMPYTETLQWDGLLACGAGFVLFGSSLCPWDPNDDTMVAVSLTDGLEAIAFGLEWDSAGGFGSQMAIAVNEVCQTGSNQAENCYTHAHKEGDSPLVFVVESPDDEWSFENTEGRTIRFGVAPASDLDVFWQHRFTLHYHLFFHHTPADEYTPIPDS